VQEKVPGTVLHSLQAVPNLKAGRSPAREPKKVRPVEVSQVEAVLPYLSPVLADALRVQLQSGARPGEVLSMRWSEIDCSKAVWIYRPTQHKNAYRGHGRAIAIGPRAQQVLERYRHRPVGEFIFSPEEAVEIQRAQRRANRKTPLWASHVKRYSKQRKSSPKRVAGAKSAGHARRRASLPGIPTNCDIGPRPTFASGSVLRGRGRCWGIRRWKWSRSMPSGMN
jgi:integrase